MGLERNITAQKTTVLTITANIAEGETYSVIANGTGYTKTGDDGDLKGSADSLLKSRTQGYLNGMLMQKGIDYIWVSSTTFTLEHEVDGTDVIIILD